MTQEITAQNSVFLFIDVQEKLVGMLNKDTCARKAEILAKLSNVLNIKSVVTEQYPKGLGSTINSVKENLKDNSKIIVKTSFNALNTEGLEKELEGYKNIFVFGIETHICVFQTVMALLAKSLEHSRSFWDDDFNVFVIKDACASREKDEFKTAINLMERAGAGIITTEMVLFEMIKTSQHPNFKELQALIK